LITSVYKINIDDWVIICDLIEVIIGNVIFFDLIEIILSIVDLIVLMLIERKD